MPAPSLPIRIGVVGLSTNGGWASTLLAPLLDPTSPVFQKYKLVALSTRSAESASATAEKYAAQLGHAVRAYHGASGARDLAQDPDVDLVVVAVKVTDHKAAVLPAIEAGKDVFVEWPLGKGLQETLEIAQKAKAKGVRAMVGTQAIHTPLVRKVSRAASKLYFCLTLFPVQRSRQVRCYWQCCLFIRGWFYFPLNINWIVSNNSRLVYGHFQGRPSRWRRGSL